MPSGMEAVVRNHPFFEWMDEPTLALIAGCGRNVRVKEGSPLARLGSPSDVFYAIRSGRVSVEIHAPDRGPLTIETLGAGEILGWSWLFPPYTWAFDARALEEIAAIEFDGKCLRQKCEADPLLGYGLMKRFASLFAERLAAARLQLMDLYGKSTSD